MNIVFIGASGSGKDTQCNLLVERCGYTTLSTGDISRAEIVQGTPRGKQIKQFLDEGKWIPDEIIHNMLRDHITALAEQDLALNGVVRTFPQVEMLDTILEQIGQQVDAAIYFELSEEVAIERLLDRKRDDDSIALIKNRLAEFRKSSETIRDAYATRGILHVVDASLPIEEVHQKIIKAIGLE